jgi:sulfonate transport system ATP-binding protein
MFSMGLTTERVALDIRRLAKTFHVDGREVVALRDVSFTVAAGEFVSIVGPSGCGKSTLLRLIAGLDVPDGGVALADGSSIRRPSRQRGIVFQEHRLFPWLDVSDNIALGLLKSAATPSERRGVARDLLELVGLNGFERAFPDQLSGGMAQRVAIARSLAARPDLLLLDEPFGALDSLTRRHMQVELLRIHEREHVTMLMVTHDVEEAVFLSNRIVLMDRLGRVRRVDEVTLEGPRERQDPAFVTLSQALRTALEAQA